MEVSLNWLKNYLDIHLSADEISEILTAIGLEVEGMKTVESIKGGLKGIVTGEVKTCAKHPNADKLSVTTVNVGNEQDLHIVCGAPNVAAGQKVVVATIGTDLYDKEGKAFTIKKGKIRGEVSEGMICAEDELGLGDDHSGILVLPEDTPVGMPAADYFNIETDVVYEIGLTPNRSDATCHLGVAKDLAAYLQINLPDKGSAVKMPDVSGFQIDRIDQPIEVSVENYDACPRYAGLTIRGIKVGPSPDWMKNKLEAIGVRSINNIVDITNYILHELGQPLHAFDAEKITDGKVVVKTLEDGSIFKSLDEVDRKLSDQDLMICDGASKGMCIAGVFGGINSGVTEGTTSIFLESAHFSAKWIRRTSMRHLLRTDAAKVFEKGSDPNVVILALKRAALLIKELAGGEITSEIVDLYPNPINPVQIEVRYQRVRKLVGTEIPIAEIKAILKALEMDIVEEGDEVVKVAIPTNKSDVTREVDVIEEILRIYGLNRVPTPDQINFSVNHSDAVDASAVRKQIGAMLVGSGFSEAMALSLSQSRYYQDVLPMKEEKLVFINNTSNIHLDIMRPDMLLSSLETVVNNLNRQNLDLKLFEFGSTYQQEEGALQESRHLSLTLTGKQHPETWLQQEPQEVNFYTLKAYVHLVMNRLGVTRYQEKVADDQWLTYGQTYHRGPQHLVTFGKVQKGLLKKMDIKQDVYFATFDWDRLTKASGKVNVIFEELNKFPGIRRDLALVVEKSVKFNEIADIAKKSGKKLIKDINLFDVYENEERLGKGKKSYAISLLFEDPTKTLKDKEVEKIMLKLITQYEQKLGALIRK